MSTAAAQQVVPEDNFAAAFEMLTQSDPAPAPQPAPEPAADASEMPQEAAPAPAPEPAPAEAGDPSQPRPNPAEAGAGPSEKPDEPAPAADEPPKASNDDDALLRRFADIVKNTPPPQPKEEPAQPQPAQPQEQPLFTPEEQEFLKTYDQDWSDVARGEALKRRAEYRELVGYVFNEVSKYLRPIAGVVEELSTHAHLQQLETTITDYNDVRDKVVDWVGKQPAYLQAAYNHVINQGTVDEVADLINRWRAETGSSLQQQAAPAQPSPKPTELPAATRQAVTALAPVSSKRSAVPQTVDSGDFDSAFAAFADKV